MEFKNLILVILVILLIATLLSNYIYEMQVNECLELSGECVRTTEKAINTLENCKELAKTHKDIIEIFQNKTIKIMKQIHSLENSLYKNNINNEDVMEELREMREIVEG